MSSLERHGQEWNCSKKLPRGTLVARGWSIVKTHDLNRLLASACEFENSFSCFAAPCQILTEQFWEQHYPGGDLEEVGEGYSELRDAVGRMVQLILVKTNKSL